MRRIALLVVPVALALLGCGGDDDDAANGGGSDDTDVTSDDASDDSGDDSSDDGGDDSGGSTELDCASVQEAATEFVIGIQVLAQLTTAEQYDAVTSGAIPFDPETFGATLQSFRALEDVDLEIDSFGTVDEALDIYQRANELAAANLATDDPINAPGAQELIDLTADTGSFISHQGAITIALDQACT